MRRLTRASAAWLAPCAYAAALLGAGFGQPVVFIVAVILTYVGEPALKRDASKTNGLYARAGFGLSVRYALRDAALVVLVARWHGATRLQVGLTAVAVAALIAGRAAIRYLGQRTAERRAMPVVTRNIDLSALAIPDALPPFVANRAETPMLYASGVPLVGALIGLFAGGALPVLIAAATAAVFAVGLVAAAVPPARRAGRMPSKKKVLAEVKRHLDAYAPEVVIYFSGSRSSLYQINMWLPVAAGLRQRTMIVMRDRANMRLLGTTALPVVCMPDTVDLMSFFPRPSTRIVLYPAHVGNNLHFLRIPGIAHAFICHGESDKLANINPYSKAYDEVWVAGLAARERYALAEVGVRDEDIAEVGGPHLASIQHAARGRGPSAGERGGLTVLYAPTWEGWTDDPQNTSVTGAGPAIVEHLLAHPAVARVIYKPHPLTGTRSPAAAKSSKKVISLLAGSKPVGAPAVNALRAEVDAALDRATALLRPGVDDAQASRDDGQLPPDCVEQESATITRWSQAFWSSPTSSGHQIVTGTLPELFDCFNECDVLIADISGVIADFLVSDKPYVVTNSSGLDGDAFRAKFPTTRGAYLTGPDCADLDRILTDLRDGSDPIAEERRKLRDYVVAEGSDRFQGAVDRLIATATQRMVRRGDIR